MSTLVPNSATVGPASGNGHSPSGNGDGHTNGNGNKAAAGSLWPDNTAAEETKRFLMALFSPGDLVGFRPTETWTEDGRRASVVDYEAVTYRCFGLRSIDGDWVWFQPLIDRLLATFPRYAAKRTNAFFGVCPREGPDGRYDHAWQIRTVRAVWADVDNCTVEEALEDAKRPNFRGPRSWCPAATAPIFIGSCPNRT